MERAVAKDKYVRPAQADYSPEFRYHCKSLHRLEAAVMELGLQLNASTSFREPTCLAMAKRLTVPCTATQHCNICIPSTYTPWKRAIYSFD